MYKVAIKYETLGLINPVYRFPILYASIKEFSNSISPLINLTEVKPLTSTILCDLIKWEEQEKNLSPIPTHRFTST